MSLDDELTDAEFLLRQKLVFNKKKSLDDGFKKNKTINEVLDKKTIFTLYDLIKSKIIRYVNGVVRAGKESVVFWAIGPNNENIALKVYLTSTSNFKKRAPYILGDPRFSRIKKGTRNLVYLWAKKEFQNLLHCKNNGIPVVTPITIKNNVLVLDFVGQNGIPEKTLLESQISENDFVESITLLTDLYQKANLVHGDFSEYNIFKTKNGLLLFDFGSAVNIQHPRSNEFLQRDINNICNFFVKRGLTVENPVDIFRRITK